MALFNRGPKNPCGAHGKPKTGAYPEGGYGSYGAPSEAQKYSAKKGKPEGGKKGVSAYKPSGGYGTYGKPKSGGPSKNPKSTPRVNIGDYASDKKPAPKSPIPTKKSKLFNLPNVKVRY